MRAKNSTEFIHVGGLVPMTKMTHFLFAVLAEEQPAQIVRMSFCVLVRGCLESIALTSLQHLLFEKEHMDMVLLYVEAALNKKRGMGVCDVLEAGFVYFRFLLTYLMSLTRSDLLRTWAPQIVDLALRACEEHDESFRALATVVQVLQLACIAARDMSATLSPDILRRTLKSCLHRCGIFFFDFLCSFYCGRKYFHSQILQVFSSKTPCMAKNSNSDVLYLKSK